MKCKTSSTHSRRESSPKVDIYVIPISVHPMGHLHDYVSLYAVTCVMYHRERITCISFFKYEVIARIVTVIVLLKDFKTKAFKSFISKSY